MANAENLKTLHLHEEKLRAQSLAIIDKSETLKAHFHIVHEAMNVVYALTHDHLNRTEEELTLQKLGIRLFNASAASIKLALSGYYQVAFAQLRDIVETYFLLDYFLTNKDKLKVWKKTTDKREQKIFRPQNIRDELDRRDGFKEKIREDTYKRLSQYASHPTYDGFSLTRKENLHEVGPFIAEEKLTAWLEEMVKLFGHGACIYAQHFQNVAPELEAVRKQYFDSVKALIAKLTQAGE